MRQPRRSERISAGTDGTLKRVIQTQGVPPLPERTSCLWTLAHVHLLLFRLPGLQLLSASVSKRATDMAFTSTSASILRGPWTDFSSLSVSLVLSHLCHFSSTSPSPIPASSLLPFPSFHKFIHSASISSSFTG